MPACREAAAQQITKQSLLQINRYIFDNGNNIHENNLKKIPLLSNDTNNVIENLKSKNGKYNLIFYDIDKNETIIIEKNLESLKTLEGLSELNFNNKLFLCGNSSPDDKQGSFLFELNPFNPETQIYSNSKYSHYYPSLISIKNKSIYCIGGKNQIKCESYDNLQNKWISLPDLPEERYLCTLCHDELNNIVYLFGGINNMNKIENNKIYIEYNNFLRLKNDNNIGFIWEKIDVKNNNNLLNRISSGSLIFEGQENYIYIFGGENDKNQLLDDIITFDISTQNICETNKTLEFPTKFLNQYPIKSDTNQYLYVFFDKFNNAIKIDKHNFVDFTFGELNI